LKFDFSKTAVRIALIIYPENCKHQYFYLMIKAWLFIIDFWRSLLVETAFLYIFPDIFGKPWYNFKPVMSFESNFLPFLFLLFLSKSRRPVLRNSRLKVYSVSFHFPRNKISVFMGSGILEKSEPVYYVPRMFASLEKWEGISKCLE
jgi:hypothetical protein